MKLHLFDCSNYIYAGNFVRSKNISRGVREIDGMYSANSSPCGGISFLINELLKFRYNDNFVIPVFDSKPTIKYDMYHNLLGGIEDYKGTRKETPKEIYAQKEYARRILDDCGFPVNYCEGYEADDLIAALVKYYKEDFEVVYVHSMDSDLRYLVDINVEIALVGKRGTIVNMKNYSTNAVHNEICYYNTCICRKLYNGDKADNIPGIGKEWIPIIDKIIPAEDYSKLGDLNILRNYVKQAVLENPTQNNAHLALGIFDLICPLTIQEDFLNLSDFDPDWNKLLKFYAINFGCEESRLYESIKYEKGEDIINDFISAYYE